MIATTIEQSEELLRLGLPAESADMWWSNRFVYWKTTPMIGIATEQNQLYTYKWCDEDIPAWSLSALLEVMPKDMTCGVVFKPRYKQPSGREVIKEWWAYCVFRDIVHYNESDNDQLTAAYNLVCYLLKQGLIKK